VPVGAFCGACGSRLGAAGEPAERHRAHAFAAAPGEHLLQPSLVTTLFPQLPHRSRAPFRSGLAALGVALVVLGLLRSAAPVVAVSALALPLLFQLYLHEVDVYEEEPWHRPVLVLLCGASLGVAYAYWTGPIVTRALTLHPFTPLGDRSLFVAGVLVPLGAQALMLVPAVLAWLLGSRRGESLDGFVVGAAGALGFVLTDTLTRLWPQLSEGIAPAGRSASSVLVEGLLQGVTVPVVAACGTGLVVTAWWSRRRDKSVHGGRWATSPLFALAVVIVVQAGLGVADLWRPGDAALLGLHATAAALLLLALRVGLHFILLHEQHEVSIGGPAVCAHCVHIVPEMPFCPHCGAARRAASRHARRALSLAEADGAEPA
jgi:hypothetical protein